MMGYGSDSNSIGVLLAAAKGLIDGKPFGIVSLPEDVCDGITDASDAFIDAVNEVSSDGGSIWIPGPIRLTKTIPLKSHITLLGDMPCRMETFPYSETYKEIYFDTPDDICFDITDTNGVRFVNLAMTGRGKVGTVGIYGERNKSTQIIGCKIRYFRIGVQFLDSSQGHYIGHTRIDNCGTYGLYGQYGWTDSNFEGLWIGSCGRGVHFLSGSHKNIFSKCHFQWCNEYGVNFNGCKGIQLENNVFDRNAWAGLRLSGNMVNNDNNAIIVGNIFWRNSRLISGDTSSCQLFLDYCGNTNISSNSFVHGVSDDGSGVDSPDRCINYVNCNDVFITTNKFKGGCVDTDNEIVDQGGNTNVIFNNNLYTSGLV